MKMCYILRRVEWVSSTPPGPLPLTLADLVFGD
jgi:hypothetical protein